MATRRREPNTESLELCLESDARLVAEAAQAAQNATAGYVCDYCTKRGPVGINEIKEWMNTEIWRPG